MNKNNGFSSSGIIIAVVLALLLGGGLYVGLSNKPKIDANDEAPISAEMPVPGMEGVDEMIVAPANDSMTGDDMAPPETGAASPAPAPAPEPTPVIADNIPTFNISARNYSYSRNEIKVRRGEKVRIILDVTEGMHDWVVDELNVRTPIIKAGETATIEFTPDQSGVFEFYCSVGQHRKFGMYGNFVVL